MRSSASGDMSAIGYPSPFARARCLVSNHRKLIRDVARPPRRKPQAGDAGMFNGIAPEMLALHRVHGVLDLRYPLARPGRALDLERQLHDGAGIVTPEGKLNLDDPAVRKAAITAGTNQAETWSASL